jgi:hypothetical protein
LSVCIAQWLRGTGMRTYEIGRALRHLFMVSSPCAVIFLGSPNTSRHLGSCLMRSTARLNCEVRLSGENTSVQRKYPTPPCIQRQRYKFSAIPPSSRRPYREYDTSDDHAEVEALLRRARGLLARRQLIPRDKSIVVESCDFASARAWRRRSTEAVLRCV